MLVIFDDELDAEKMALRIKEFRKHQRRSDIYEFKFTKTNKNERCKFLEIIKNNRFRIRAIVFNKRNIYSPILKTIKEKFYNYAIKILLEHNNSTIKSAKIRLDGLGDRTFKRSLTTYLRKNLNSRDKKIMDNIEFVNSKSDLLIQLADMVAGSIMKSYENKTDSEIYKKIINKRIDDIWEFK